MPATPATPGTPRKSVLTTARAWRGQLIGRIAAGAASGAARALVDWLLNR
ncbi:hypothetical protein OG552_36005 [Streptomyces sp. NBC_01476]|nr:hypothetical protein [Streptomyces sp. NBC_01476]